ncbi:GWxTD domain-containing protein [Bacteroidota bacterium]
MKYFAALLFFFNTVISLPQSDIDFEFDYAQFSSDSSSNYVEFYYSFNQASLAINYTDSINYTQGLLHITIADSISGEIVVDRKWYVTQAVSEGQNLNQNLVGVIGFILNRGIYNCEIRGVDAINGEKARIINELLEVNPFSSVELSLGDIQLASNIIPGSENTSSVFYKNTFEVMPIPTCTFGENQPVLFYYSELYNIPSEPTGNNLRIDEHVFNSRGQIVSQKSKFISRTLRSRVEVGRVLTFKLPTDTYTLVLSLVDSAASYGVSSAKKFFVYNPSVEYVDTFKTTGTNIVVGMFGVMSDEELDDFFSKSKYIAKDSELEMYEGLTTENAKREFLTNFWKARDEDPSDDLNYYLRDYIRRIEESTQSFEALGKDGWKTDRGRIYVVYGPPSEINRYPNEAETRPYEIWNYHNIEGGVEFIFGDITGFSNYRLLHSNKRGEMNDPNWQRRIRVQ